MNDSVAKALLIITLIAIALALALALTCGYHLGRDEGRREWLRDVAVLRGDGGVL